MKNYKFLNIILTFFLIAGLSSCDNYLDVNTDPNNPTTVTPDLVLPVGQVFTAAYMHGDRRASHLGGMLMYNWSESQGFSWYNDEFQYLVTTTFYARLFDNAYSDGLKQYQVLINLEDPKYTNYVAIGKIMKSYHAQLLVDFYGNIPYFEALGRKANPTPVYDDAQTVYNDLLVQLTDAISLIKAAAADEVSEIPGADDAMFGGEMTEWIKFANTLKVRILTRMSDVASGSIASELAAIDAEGSGFITENVAINPGFLDEENKQNPFWAAFGAGPDGTKTLTNNATCATQFILDYLTTTSDPRIDFLYEKPATGHLGVEQGVEPGPAFAPDFVSNIGPGLLIDSEQGSTIFTLAESFLNQAELALAGFGGDPEALYNSGVKASFDFLGVDDADYDSYAAQSLKNVSYAASTDKLEAIITQKWLAVNGVTAEQSWFDYNRTGYPLNLPISAEASTPDRPVRLFYPASELSSNSLNVPAQPNAFTTKIFWAN